MFEQKSLEVRRTLYFYDTVLTIVSFLVAFEIRAQLIEHDSVGFFSHIAVLPLAIALLIGSLPPFGAYRAPRYSTVFSYFLAVFQAVAFTISVLLVALFFLKIQYVSRVVVLIFAVLLLLSLFSLRLSVLWYFRRTMRKGLSRLKVIIIGTGERARNLTRSLRKDSEWGVDVVGYLDVDTARVGTRIGRAVVLGTVDDIERILKDNVVDEVILAIPRTMLEVVEAIAYACQEEGVKFRIMADIFKVNVSRMTLARVGETPLLTLEPVAQDETKLIIKRLLDLALVVVGLPLLIPVMIIIALAIKLDSPGPVFFVQDRVGLRKHLFRMYKFRSMRVGSEDELRNLEQLNEAEGPIFKIKDDPRTTRVGKFIRKTSLDELPQLINVLRGEMSLVGPRPMSVRDVDLFDKGIQRKRFSVKPGVTCLWQISGRSNLPFSKWLELDLQYIENWSLRLDLYILLKTFPAVLFGTGAS